MDLNSIELSPDIITGLYKNILYEFNDAGLPGSLTGSSKDRELKSVANTQHDILVIVDYGNEDQLPAGQLIFLTNILGACKISMKDIALVNMRHHAGEPYKEIIKRSGSKQVFLFGVEPGQFGLPINFPQFQIQPFDNCTFLFSPELEHIENDKILKSKLWVCLQKMFPVI